MMISPVVAAPNPGEAVAVDIVSDGETNNEHQASLPASLVVQAEAASGEDGNNKEPLSDLAVVNILVRWINNKDDVPPFVHHLDLYRCSPWEAVQGRKHALRATRHEGGEETWFVVSEDGNRRGRKVGEAGTWHGEGAPKPILGADGSSVVANKKRFSYKMGAAPGKSGKQESTGWIRMQIALEGAHQNPNKVISMVYKSSHAKTWMELASSYAIAGACQEDIEISVDAPVPAAAVSKASSARFRPRARATAAQKGKAALDVAAVSRDGEKADATQLSLTRGIPIDLLLQAARKAVRCVDYKEAVQIEEFEAAKLIYHTSMTELRLDSTILSGSFNQLDDLIQQVAMDKKLTPDALNHLVCLAERMSGTIFSEYLNELPTRGRQAFNALERLGVDVQEALQMPSKGMKISPLVIPGGEAKDFALEFLLSAAALVAAGNKRPIPSSFTAASSSGVKRLRQERTETPPIATLEEGQRHLMPDEYPVGGDKAEDFTEIFAADMFNGVELTPIGGSGGAHDGFLVAFADHMPGVAEEDLEEPVGAHGFTAEQEQLQWLEADMAEPPSAPCRLPEETMLGRRDILHQFAFKDSACRSLVGAEGSTAAAGAFEEFDFDSGATGSTALATSAGGSMEIDESDDYDWAGLLNRLQEG